MNLLPKSMLRPVAKAPTNLTEWLEIATGKLIPSAQAQVRAEIETHYADAVETNRRRGASDVGAHAAALEDLGNAQTAGARFCLEYPCTLDAKIVAGIAWYQISMGILMASHLAFDPLTDSNAQPGLLALLLIVFVVCVVCPAVAIFVSVLVSRTRQAVTQRVIYMLLLVTWLNLGAWLLTKHFDDSSDHVPRVLQLFHGEHLFQLLHLGRLFQLADMSPFIFMTVFGSFLLLCLRRKLASAHEDDLPTREIPPLLN